MRLGGASSLGLCVLSLLAACSNPPSAKDGSSGAATTVAAPIPAPTDAEKRAIVATLPTAYQRADLDNGQSKLALCKSCHTIKQGEDSGVGPNLWGVFGRRAGSLAGFSYSSGMKALGVTWDADHINTWITKPSAMVPGTKMTYAGMENPKDRIDVIAYLKTVTTAPPK